MAAIAHYRGAVPSCHESDPGVPAFSSDYCVDVEREADGNLADVYAASEPLDHTVLKTKLKSYKARVVVSTLWVPP